MKKLLKIIFLFSSLLVLTTFSTNSYFSDRVTVSDNTFQAGEWPTGPDWQNIVASDSQSKGPFMPAMAYGNGRFGIIFYDSRGGNNELYFSLINGNGDKIGADFRVTNDPGDSFDPSIVWNGNDFGIIWYESWQIFFARISSDGVIIQDKTLVAGGVHPSVAWNPATEQYGLTWWGDGTKFVRLDINGNIVGDIITLNSVFDGGYYRPRITTSGNNYGITWGGYRTGNPEVCFSIVNKNGEKIGDDKLATSTGNEVPWTITWNDHEYAIVTQGNSGISLLRIDESKNILEFKPLPGGFSFAHSRYFNLAWADDRYLLSFVDMLVPSDADIFIAQYDRFGNMVKDFYQISTSENHDYYPGNIVLVGKRAALPWVFDLWGPNQKIYFAQGID